LQRWLMKTRMSSYEPVCRWMWSKTVVCSGRKCFSWPSCRIGMSKSKWSQTVLRHEVYLKCDKNTAARAKVALVGCTQCSMSVSL
jgi:hypothetical protein